MSQPVHSKIIYNSAALAVAAQLGLDPKAVGVTRGISPEPRDGLVRVGPLPEKTDRFSLAIEIPGLDFNQEQARKGIMDRLAGLAPLAAFVQTEATEDLAKDVKAQLTQAVAGTDFDQRLLAWPGFDPKVAKDTWATRDFAIQPNVGGLGVEVHLSIPAPAGEDKTDTALMQKLDGNIEGRKEAIRAALTETVVAHMKQAGKSEAEIAKAQQDMATLHIAANKGNWGNQVRVTLRSPAQAEAVAKGARTYDGQDNADALNAGNPLMQLPHDYKEGEPSVLQLALNKAFLHTGDTKEILPLVAGRHDMKEALLVEARRLAQTSPDQAAAIEQIAGSDLLKDRAVPEGAPLPPAAPVFVHDKAKPDTLEISFAMEPEKVNAALHGLAALGQQLAAPMQAAPAATPAMIAAAGPRNEGGFVEKVFGDIASSLGFGPARA